MRVGPGGGGSGKLAAKVGTSVAAKVFLSSRGVVHGVPSASSLANNAPDANAPADSAAAFATDTFFFTF